METGDLIAALADEGRELACCNAWCGPHVYARQPFNAVTSQNICGTIIKDFDAVRSRHLTGDPDRSGVIFPVSIEDFYNLARRVVGKVLWNGPWGDQPGFAVLLKCDFPAVDA